MKKVYIALAAITFAATLCSCGGGKKGYDPSQPGSEMSDEEREARIAEKKAEYNSRSGENLADYQGKIKLTVLIPSDENLNSSIQKKLEAKLLQLVTANGIGGMGGDPRYILAPITELQKVDVTSTAPVRHLVEYGITFYVADIITGTVFASQEIKLKGVGDSDELATIAAFDELKTNDSRIKTMLQTAEQKIVEFYTTHGDEFIKQAEMLAAQEKYAQAIAILGSIPVEAESAYPTAVKMISELMPKYFAKESNLALSQLKAALGKPGDENGYNAEAMEYYALIPNDSPLKAEADALVKKYKLDVSKRQTDKAEHERFQAELQAKVQMTANKCLLDKYKKDAAYDRLPWFRKLIYLGNHDPFDGYTPEEGC